MAKKIMGICKDCVVYAMCTDMCNEANAYVNDITIRHIEVDYWTWKVMIRENNYKRHRRSS